MTGGRRVLDLVLDGEQVIVVDRDAAVEDEALAIVPGQIERRRRGQFAAGRRPERIGTGQEACARRRNVADLGVERLWANPTATAA